MPNPFNDEAMAAGYAAARPPVHAHVLALLREWLGTAHAGVAADLGCGAGLSLRPLLTMADTCIGIDPAVAMVRAARTVVPEAQVTVASAEAIPLRSTCVDLLTAAGSLNYVPDIDAAWREAGRVLTPAGTLAVYDFSAGKSFVDDDRLDRWFASFVARYPPPAGQARALSPDILATTARGFEMVRAEDFAIPISLSPSFHVEYMLTETNVQHAVQHGTPLDRIRAWCEATLPGVFGHRDRDVVFRGYLAVLRRR